MFRRGIFQFELQSCNVCVYVPFFIHSPAAYFVFFCELKNMMTAKNFFHVTGNYNQLNQFSALKRRRKNAARPRTDAQHSTKSYN